MTIVAHGHARGEYRLLLFPCYAMDICISVCQRLVFPSIPLEHEERLVLARE
jgi:hypothetical protein